MTRRDFILTVVVFVVFAAYGTWRCPIPGAGEPHYLSKAKHFWDAQWCDRDLFLSSADSHWVFYVVIGPLTRVLTLQHTACVGRILVWGALAFAWVRLVGQLVPGRPAPVTAAFTFLALQVTGFLAGEWLVGGVESKGFSYAALLLAITAACRRSWRQAAAAIGIAISFHPVVGVWGAISLLGAASPQLVSTARSVRGCRRILSVFALGVACSLPGLIPAISTIVSVPSPETARLANEIQVFYRLSHHLVPSVFPSSGYVMDAVLLVLWSVLSLPRNPNSSLRLFNRFVFATLLIALAGFDVALSFESAGLMKFYPFRLLDIFLPMAVAIAACDRIERLGVSCSPSAGDLRASFAPLGNALLLVGAANWICLAPDRDVLPVRGDPQVWEEFIDACLWIEKNTPSDSLFLTPKFNFGFKWYAQRAEYVSRKDCPQDAAGIVEWKRRLDWIDAWRSTSQGNQTSRDANWNELRRQTDIEYFLDYNAATGSESAVYRNRIFSVYRIAD